MPVACSNGERMYVRLRSEEYFEQQINNVGVQSRTVGLLSVPYEKLWEQAQLYIQKKLDQEEAAEHAKSTEPAEPAIDSGYEDESESETADLWVEKYKPRSYLELLSDEGANRTLLHWLKLWDKVVFNRERKVKQKGKEADAKKDNRFQKKFKGIVNDELDEHGCPQQKVALLCGPPGLGKTTLAHMVGTHAGYNVVEVNASDDRSPESFRLALEAATQMRAVMGTNPRPNCLVLDEIDGAPAASIDVLIKFIQGKDTGRGRGKKKGRGGSVLKRPVICICNDVYVPALRALRQVALIVQFPPTMSSRLAQRLLEIARKQHIRTDMGALLALAEKSNNDIRSCLSVLHFFKSQKKDVRLKDIQKSNVGQKDVQKSLFNVWHEVFQIQRSKRRTCSTAVRDGSLEPMPDLNSPEMKFGDMSLTSRMHSVLRTVQCCGDYDRLMQGVYENYLNMSFKDSRLEAVSLGMEWFCTADVMSHKIHTSQNYILMPYQPFVFVMWHFLFSSLSWPKITYPSAGYEASMKEQRNRLILRELMQGMAPLVRVHANSAHLVFDTLPMLLQILVPTLRPVSMQLYSPREKEELYHVISVMIDYNLNYVQERTLEGSYAYKLDPNVEELVLFPGQKPSRMLSYGGKQLISREVELEKMRRAEAKLQAGSENTQEKKEEAKENEKGKGKEVSSPATLPNHLQVLQPKVVNAEMQCRDFFGRVVKHQKTSTDKARTDEIVKSDIWFHYKEGFSNAVRRSVKVQDLLEEVET
ncbi:chromosome transmission fidelity protein 18 homolog isoform X2 [Periplaneta americana]